MLIHAEMQIFLSNLLKLFVPTFLTFRVSFYILLSKKVDTPRTLYRWVILGSSQTKWEKKERRYWQGFSHYSSWWMNIRIYHFYCCDMDSARENDSPHPSLCHSLHWYAPALVICFLQIIWNCFWWIFVSFLWKQLIMIWFSGVMNSLFSVYGILSTTFCVIYFHSR